MTLPALALHGGAGTITAASLSAQDARGYRQALHDIAAAAQALLLEGGSALDAVCLAVQMLEDCPLFNAGHGAVFTHAATHELDAAVMDGRDLRAGAIAGVSRLRNPVHTARAVMEDGAHVLLAGAGAEAFAQERGLTFVDPAYFSTPMRREQLERVRAAGRVVLDHDGASAVAEASGKPRTPLDEDRKMGTVGAVAVDRHGHLAAATSTGGMTNKRVGRIGDSPLIGAGTYADDRYAAISCTGSGEMFIRAAAAYDVCARMRYAGQSLTEAADAVVHQSLPALGGTGGLIAVDRHGNLALPFNTEGMYRAHVRGADAPVTAIHR
ncbi:isoaspartyl peptidase/L-asparaginase family protein [Pseudacidovorax sp. RU35E]|uniref:isoaspartyl peptidase/L-asparaginase family protein n=1 Tax=Pseudacidovorax sp. RU35E TaxID=1907403 RepID=UPI000954FBF4|nr:isoaspartyl peptidase/L-asparaginase [Pseudacidovorax sp. RU35E]SIQ69601.1 beta-aspartyl-peptidase (threonine type) [Pseudacidovorax sp. RU35E]